VHSTDCVNTVQQFDSRSATLNNLACVISRQFDVITFVGLSRVTCVTQLHCLSNCLLNSAVKNEPIRIILLLKVLKKFKVSTTDKNRRVDTVTVCADTSSEICDLMLASDEFSTEDAGERAGSRANLPEKCRNDYCHRCKKTFK